MKILTGKKWREGFLDYHQNKKEQRVQILAWKNLERLENVYHTRPKSLRLLMNYFPVVGFEGLWTKTWSRLREDRRNEKYISCGIGKNIKTGNLVGFLAPWHPALAERIVLPETLIFPIDEVPKMPAETILYLPLYSHSERLYSHSERSEESRWWKNFRAWSVYSGVKISDEDYKNLYSAIITEIKNADWSKAEKISLNNSSAITEIKGKITKTKSKKKSGVLFGYGNYAKINIIPYTRKFIDLQTIHEIDPTQIVVERGVQKWDSAPLPRPDEKYDVYFVASYNHTHAPISIHALNQGAYVLVEKPVVNDYDELNELERALRQAGRKLFIGFHKRYGLFNQLALKDLGVSTTGEPTGEPISYHSIVYELIQPELFWYNWPISRSTFFANGCHQIDHFLHLNKFSQPKDFNIKLLQDGAVEVWIELENGATFTTTFSEKGVSRVGPRDHVELKMRGRNIWIEDAIRYKSEDNHRIIRRTRVFKTNAYKDMYQTISRKIANNEPGDTIESTLISTKLMLDLEEKLQKMKGWDNRYKESKKEFWNYFN